MTPDELTGATTSCNRSAAIWTVLSAGGVPGEPGQDPDARLHARSPGRIAWAGRCEEGNDTYPPGELMRSSQRERAAAGLARQREPVQAEVTS